MTTRYEQLVGLVKKHRPRSIAEVGVHRGYRGALMSSTAIEMCHAPVDYWGFDVFETMDKAFHEKALNGKGIVARREAEARLHSVSKLLRVHLVVGDTRETLHKQPIAVDFAFIDGDHRVEVIRGDAAAINAPVLVFDDYYRPGGDGRCPDLIRYGANAVVHELEAAGAKVDILPAGDMCKHGGVAYLAVVLR